jgi:DNA segregation ATPase FtsK/SpoIIIE-like protein
LTEDIAFVGLEFNNRYDYKLRKIFVILHPFSTGAMALRATSWRTLVLFFFLVVSVQIIFTAAWSWARWPPLPRLERKGLVFTDNVEG